MFSFILILGLIIFLIFMVRRSDKKIAAERTEMFNFEPSKCLLNILGKDDNILFSKEFIGSLVKVPWNASFYYDAWNTAEKKALAYVEKVHRDGFIYQKDQPYINTRDVYNFKIDHIVPVSAKERYLAINWQ